MQKFVLTQLKYFFCSLLCTFIVLFSSCSGKKAYERKMELAFQHGMTAKMLYDNDGILICIEKEVTDNGGRPKEVAILDHAKHIRDTRNQCIGSAKSMGGLMDNIKEAIKLADDDDDRAAVSLLNYYRKEMHENNDSLVFQKFINVYLTLEQKILDDDLSSVSGSCNWGSDLSPHVTKTTDTVSVGQLYELVVIPATYNYNVSYITDTCKMTVYRNDVPVDTKASVMRKGFVYLIALVPTQSGNYSIRGTSCKEPTHIRM